MEAKVITEIKDLAIAGSAVKTIKIEGREHSLIPDGFTAKLIEHDTVIADQPMEFYTLGQFIERCRAVSGLMAHVVSPVEVVAYGNKKYDGTRFKIAEAEAMVPTVLNANVKNFRTIEFKGDPTRILTILNSAYENTPARQELMQALGSIKDVNDSTVESNGVTQNLTVKKGPALAQAAQIKNPVVLKPKLTFSELPMPDVEHIVVVKSANEIEIFSYDTAWFTSAVTAIYNQLKISNAFTDGVF